MEFSSLPPAAAYLLFLTAVCGACAGSFIDCAALRWTAGEKLPRGRSRCPKCGHTLGPSDLVPVFSWLFLRGRCRYCGDRISRRCPLTELACAVAWTLAAARFGFAWETAEHCVLFGLLLFLALVDMDTMLLPDGPMLTAAAVFLIFLPAHERPLLRLGLGAAGALLYGGGLLALSLIMDKVLGKESIGGGDVKLIAVLGLYTGPVAGLRLVLTSSLLGLLFAAVSKNRGPFPFGPALAMAAVPATLWGGRIF